MRYTRILVKAILLLFSALMLFTAPVHAAWPALPTDDEIQAAATRFVQEKAFDREPPDCDAIADANERNLCVTRFGMNFMFSPEYSYRGEITEASTLKMHHTAQPDPLVGSAVALLYTQKLWVIHRDGDRYTKLTYGKALLDYGGNDPEKPGWYFNDNRWWAYDPDDLDASLAPNAGPAATIGDPSSPGETLSPRAWRDATVYVLFKPLDDRGYYGWMPGFRQNLTVVGYSGETDPTRMPLTFWITLEDAGKPLPGTQIPFEVGGDVKCLADRYAIWDDANRQWLDRWHNFATGPVSTADAPVTDTRGLVTVRLFLDFSRMRLFDLQLPCTLQFAAFAPNPASPQTFQKAETTLEVKSPAFIRSIFYNVVTREGAARKDNIFGLNQLRDWYQPITPSNDRFGLNPTPTFEEPTQARVLSRISLDGQEFVPPTAHNDYYAVLRPGTILSVDASSQPLPVNSDGSGRLWTPRHGDGIGLTIMWLDGTTGLFVVHNRSPDINSVLRMRFVEGWGTTQGAPSSDEAWFTRFVISQGADWVVKSAVVGGATLVGGPVAGAWAGIIVEGAQKVNDLRSIGELSRQNARVIWIRSIVALTSEAEGRQTLYVFEGSPGVEDAQGNEIAVAAGQAVEFTQDGDVSPPSAQDPPALALALLEALPDADPPIAATLEENAPSAHSQNGLRRDDDSGMSSGEFLDDLLGDLPHDILSSLSDDQWTLVAGVGALVVVIVFGTALRRRGRRAQSGPMQAGDFAVVPEKAPSAAPRKRRSPRPSAPPSATRDVTRPSPDVVRAGNPRPQSAPARTCSRCGQPVRATARFCAHCGEPRVDPALVALPPTPVCPNCHTPVRPGVHFCGACGHQLHT